MTERLSKQTAHETDITRLLSNDLPGMRRNRLRETVRESLRWAHACGGFDERERAEEYWEIPRFVPDATRWRKCQFSHAKGDPKPCVEMWEIVNTCHLSDRKIRKIEGWLFRNWEGAMIPFFELWQCNRWGQGRHMVFSMARDWYDIKLIDWKEQHERDNSHT